LTAHLAIAEFNMSETWFLLETGPGEPGWNMALDEAMLQSCESLGTPILRLYSWITPAATFGYFQKHSEIETWSKLRPLIRRPTGGGLVPHISDWTYSLSFPPDHWWYQLKATESYQLLHQWISDSFKALEIRTQLAPEAMKEIPGQCFAGAEKFDLLLGGQKIAGAAQRRLKNGLLIQGSIQRQPEKLTRTQWEKEFLNAASGKWDVSWQSIPNLDSMERQADELNASKYSSNSYNQQR
jgi:lipoate-protein ligase A